MIIGWSLWKIERSVFLLWSRQLVLTWVGFAIVFGILSSVSGRYRTYREAVVEAVLSFTKGMSSDNVHTRFYLWEDALSEIFSVGLFWGMCMPISSATIIYPLI